jgi:hypothetical protein
VSKLFGLGIPSKNQEGMRWQGEMNLSRYVEGRSLCIPIVFREAPECNYQWLSDYFNPVTAGTWIHQLAEGTSNTLSAFIVDLNC